MYKQNVKVCNKSKYTKANSELLSNVFCAELEYISSDGNQCIYVLYYVTMP